MMDKAWFCAGVTQEFRVVRDNRATQSYNGEIKAASFRHAISANEQAIANVSLNGYGPSIFFCFEWFFLAMI